MNSNASRVGREGEGERKGGGGWGRERCPGRGVERLVENWRNRDRYRSSREHLTIESGQRNHK